MEEVVLFGYERKMVLAANIQFCVRFRRRMTTGEGENGVVELRKKKANRNDH